MTSEILIVIQRTGNPKGGTTFVTIGVYEACLKHLIKLKGNQKSKVFTSEGYITHYDQEVLVCCKEKNWADPWKHYYAFPSLHDMSMAGFDTYLSLPLITHRKWQTFHGHSSLFYIPPL